MAPDLPFPEALPTLAAQFALLLAGVKPAVLVPHLSPHAPAPAGIVATTTPVGMVFHRAGEWNAQGIDHAVRRGMLGFLLGYGVAEKPAHPTGVLVLRDAAGLEVVTVNVDERTRATVAAALARMQQPGMTIEAATPLAVLRARAAWWMDYFATQQEDPSYA